MHHLVTVLQQSRQAKATLLMFSECVTLNYVVLRVCKKVNGHKSPKVSLLHGLGTQGNVSQVLAEGIKFIDAAVTAFGLKVAIKPVVDFVKAALQASNPAVRKAAIDILGTLSLYAGPSFKTLFDDEKPALVSLITDKFKAVCSQQYCSN